MNRASNLDLVIAVLKRKGVSVRRLSESEKAETIDAWFAVLGDDFTRQQNSELNWHCFSWEDSKALEGTKAFEAYQQQWLAPIVIFDESEDWLIECEVKEYPDFSTLRKDIYVSHHNMKWTMAFTHEQPDIGPFFAVGG